MILHIKPRSQERSPTSIKKSLLNSYLLIIAVMLVPILYSVIVARLHTNWYNKVISNVSEATALGKIAKQELTDEIWSIVAGEKSFNDGEQYILLRRIRTGLSKMQQSTAGAAAKQLEVAERAETTLRYYIDKLDFQLQAGATVAENESAMEEIRSVASLLYDILQEFIVSEVESARLSNTHIQHSFARLTWLQLLICALILGIAVYTSYTVSRTIGSSIGDMSALSARIAGGDLSARAGEPQVTELSPLATNLNTMAVRLKALMDENIHEQQNLQKAEMKTLQAQITPHFLYNTFDTIIWLAESEQIDDVIEVTKAFSKFFRISLSKGHEWITVSQELDHVKSYLTIQKIRYANILDYSITASEGIGELAVLKLVLQPLVENAIYHGIKNKRGRGTIQVTAERVDAFGEAGGGITFTVSDNGMGFTPERLAEVNAEITGNKDAEALTAAYGLYNVNKRLQLYYGSTQASGDNARPCPRVQLHIASERGKGTTVSFTAPVHVLTETASGEEEHV